VSHCPIMIIFVETHTIDVEISHGTAINFFDTGSCDSTEMSSVGSVHDDAVTSI